MAMGITNTWTGPSIKDSSGRIRNTGLESISGRIIGLMSVTGLTESNTVWEFTILRLKSRGMVSGNQEKNYSGLTRLR